MPIKNIAKIREAECIGCTKCIEACPVDAILGSAKHMHTVIQQECIGCQLCVEPCPVDCIDILELSKPLYDRKHAQARYLARKQRLEQQQRKQTKNLKIDRHADEKTKQEFIRQAIARTKNNRSQPLTSREAIIATTSDS